MLEDFQDVNAFTKGIEFFAGTIDIRQGLHVTDARSFLGICSLDLTRPIDVIIQTDDKEMEEEFYRYLKKWEAVSKYGSC